MKLMMLVLIALSICSCSQIQRPDADICVVNYATDKLPHLTCFNIKRDYNDDGSLKADAKPVKKLIKTPQSLNAGKYISKEDWPAFQVWIQDTRDWAKGHCQ